MSKLKEERGAKLLYVVRGSKHHTDEWGRSYNHCWGTYYTLEEAKKEALLSTQTSYADDVTVEKYELVSADSIGSGVPVEDRTRRVPVPSNTNKESD